MRDERRTKLILVVDDDPMFRRDVCGFLEDEGYRTVAAWNGREAFGLLMSAHEMPSLIILDLVMDSVDGREFRRRQLVSARFKSLPVIVVTGLPDGDQVVQSLDVDGFLTKPLDADALIHVVDRVLGLGGGRDSAQSSEPSEA